MFLRIVLFIVILIFLAHFLQITSDLFDHKLCIFEKYSTLFKIGSRLLAEIVYAQTVEHRKKSL